MQLSCSVHHSGSLRPSRSETISRFLSSVRISVAKQISVLNFDLIMKLRKQYKGYRKITLDLDSHVICVYGNQQRAALGYNPKKKGRKSYHPLLCLLPILRRSGSGQIVDFSVMNLSII